MIRLVEGVNASASFRLRGGIIPKEGGVIGVWFSSTVYGLITIMSREMRGLTVFLALLGAILALPATGIAMRSEPGISRVKYVIPLGLLYGVLIALTLPSSAAYAIVMAVLLYGSLTLRGVKLILVGGPLLAGVGGGLALSTGNPLLPLVPIAYSLMTVSMAGGRVTGSYKAFSPLILLGGLGVIVASIAFYSVCSVSAYVLLVDVALRLGLIPMGVYEAVSTRVYGFHEAFRSLLVLGIAAACI